MEAIKVGAAVSTLSFTIAILCLGVMVRRLPTLLKMKKEEVDLSLVWPQVISGVFLFGFSLGNLILFLRSVSGEVIELESCLGAAQALVFLFTLGKVSSFLFLVRKAQIVNFAHKASKIAYLILIVLIFLYAVVELAIISKLKVDSYYQGLICQVAIVGTDTLFINYAMTVEGAICVFAIIVFVKPIVSMQSTLSNSDLSQSDSSKANLRAVIWRNFIAGTTSLLYSLFLQSIIRLRVVRTPDKYEDIIVAMSIIQTDMVVGLLAMMGLTFNMWLPSCSKHHQTHNSSVAQVKTQDNKNPDSPRPANDAVEEIIRKPTAAETTASV
jgi:hypothetical protein